MRTARSAVLPALILLLGHSAPIGQSQVVGYAEISQPLAGSAVSGVVTLRGTADHPWFVSFDLAFAYSPNVTDTWFPVGEPVQTAVRDDRLGIWDTTGLTDGNYNLRLRVWLNDGTVLTGLVENVRVRNYHPPETPTAVPTSQSTPTPPPATATQTPWPEPGPTPGPTGLAQAQGALSAGVLAGASGLGLLGLYVVIRPAILRRWTALRTRRFRSRRPAPGPRRGSSR